jgi:hypothetical protein
MELSAAMRWASTLGASLDAQPAHETISVRRMATSEKEVRSQESGVRRRTDAEAIQWRFN